MIGHDEEVLPMIHRSLLAQALAALALLVAGGDPHPAAARSAPAVKGGTGSGPRPERSPRPAAPLRVVAVGDSVTSGHACGCTAFPAQYGRLLSGRLRRPVSTQNLGVDGQGSGGLLTALGPSGSEGPAVAGADVVLVTIGANDFNGRHDDVAYGDCDPDASPDCVADEIEGLRRRFAGVLERVRALRDGRPTAVLVTGYWNVFEDGDVAARQFPAKGLAATDALTRRVNAVLALAARADGAAYVDLDRPFHTAGGADVTRLLAADGDHPDAAGHALIARALLAAGLPGLPTS